MRFYIVFGLSAITLAGCGVLDSVVSPSPDGGPSVVDGVVQVAKGLGPIGVAVGSILAGACSLYAYFRFKKPKAPVAPK